MTDPWPLPPLIPGEWKTLSVADATAVLSRYAAAEVEAGLQPSAGVVEYARVRARKLDAAPRWLLLEAEATFTDAARGLLTFFYGPGHRMVGASWDATELAEMGWQDSWRDTPPASAAVRDYTLLYVNYVRGDEGRFVIVQHPDEVAALNRDGAPPEPELVAGVAPLGVTPGDEAITAEGTVAYAGALYRASFSIARDGMVQMVDDEPIGDVRMDPEHVRGPFRVAGPDPEAPVAAPSTDADSSADSAS